MNNTQNPDEIRQFNVRIVIGFASLSSVVAASLTIAFIIAGRGSIANKDTATIHREDLTFVASAISMAAGVTGAAYALQSLRHNSRQQKKQRCIDTTRAYIDMWDEPQFAQARITIHELNQSTGGSVAHKSEQLRDLIKQKPTVKQDVTLILNLLEKVAIFRAAGLLHEPLLKQFYQPIVIRSWEVLKVYVADRRYTEGMPDELYKSLEQLHNTWNRTS